MVLHALLRWASVLAVVVTGMSVGHAAPPNGYFRFGRATIENNVPPGGFGKPGFSCGNDGTGNDAIGVTTAQFAGDGRKTAKLLMEDITAQLIGVSGLQFTSITFPGTLIFTFSTAAGGGVSLGTGYGGSFMNGQKTPLARNAVASFNSFKAVRRSTYTTISFVLRIATGIGGTCNLKIAGDFYP